MRRLASRASTLRRVGASAERAAGAKSQVSALATSSRAKVRWFECMMAVRSAKLIDLGTLDKMGECIQGTTIAANMMAASLHCSVCSDGTCALEQIVLGRKQKTILASSLALT